MGIINADNGAKVEDLHLCLSLGWGYILESPSTNTKGISVKARVVENMVTN